MALFHVLYAGMAILTASFVLALLGRWIRTRDVWVLERKGGFNDNTTERRLPFTARVGSKVVLDIKRNDDRSEITTKETSIPVAPEADIGWNLPTPYRKTSSGDNHSELALRLGTHAVVLISYHGGASDAEETLAMKSSMETLPRRCDAGIQILVAVIPLIVAGLAS